MFKQNIGPLTDQELRRLAALLTDNHEAWNKLADAIAERVGNRFFQRGWSTEGIEEHLNRIDGTLNRQGELLATMHRSIQDLRERHVLLNREIGKVNDQISST